MAIRSLEMAKDLRKEGERIGREGLAARVWELVDEFNKNRSYKNAIILAGKLKAIAQACKSDGYWDEKCSDGFHHEYYDLKRVSKEGKLPEGKESWWYR